MFKLCFTTSAGSPGIVCSHWKVQAKGNLSFSGGSICRGYSAADSEDMCPQFHLNNLNVSPVL